MHVKYANTAHPILELVAQRYSPYAFKPDAVSDEDLRSIFEAARWAASSYNEQPWRFLVARREDEELYAKLLSCLVEPNQAWAKQAPVLALGLVSRRFARNDRANAAAEHDLGMATATLSLEATARGLAVHPMIGIENDKIREAFSLPDGLDPLTGLAIGYAGEASALPEGMRERDEAPRDRKALGEFVFGSGLGSPAAFV